MNPRELPLRRVSWMDFLETPLEPADQTAMKPRRFAGNQLKKEETMKNWKTTGALLIIALMVLTGCDSPDSGNSSASTAIEKIFVEGGSFQMGSTAEDADSHESPVHSVAVSSFYMAKTELTQAQWKAVMGSDNNPSYFKGDNLPVETMSWYDAVEYCNALSAKDGLDPVYTINGTNVTADFSKGGWRLPTEAEWEYAAKGGKKSQSYKYSGSDTVGDVGWYWKNSGDKPLDGEWTEEKIPTITENNARTHPVGQKAANELGLYDMSGNVFEWCWDRYGNYGTEAQTDPTGPSSGSTRVVRGGDYLFFAKNLRSANRISAILSHNEKNLGFRPVRRM